MTKEEVFNILNKCITHIGEKFNSEECDYYLEDQLESLPFEHSIESGISKAVILIKGAPFVIKMPFFCLYDGDGYSTAYADWEGERDTAYEEFLQQQIEIHNDSEYRIPTEIEAQWFKEYNKNHPEPDGADELYYYDLEGAANIDLGEGADAAIPDWDYCRLETVIYQLALEEGLSQYFAEEGYLGTIDNTPVYYQTRCIPLNSMSVPYDSAEYQKKSKKSRKVCDELNIHCFSPIWISDFLDCYGIEEFKRLNDFLKCYEIDDLRACNIGYLDGAPILFDYSGYREW